MTDHDKVVATLVPADVSQPDFLIRAKAIWGDAPSGQIPERHCIRGARRRTVIYLDTGCLVKLYYPEADSQKVAALVVGRSICFNPLHQLEFTNALHLPQNPSLQSGARARWRPGFGAAVYSHCRTGDHNWPKPDGFNPSLKDEAVNGHLAGRGDGDAVVGPVEGDGVCGGRPGNGWGQAGGLLEDEAGQIGRPGHRERRASAAGAREGERHHRGGLDFDVLRKFPGAVPSRKPKSLTDSIRFPKEYDG